MLKHLSIALPLFIAILNIVTPASAEQIDRSYRISAGGSKLRNLDAIPLVTDLNLMVPVSASELAPDPTETSPSDLREQSSSIEPVWSDSSRKHESKIITKKKSISKLKSRLRSSTGLNIKPSILLTSEQSTKSRITPKNRSLVAIKLNSATVAIARTSHKPKSAVGQRIATRLPSLLSGNYLKLVRDPSKGTNDIGNPLYTLEAYVDGQIYQTFNAVSGTVNSQNADRNIGNNVAPLPDGLYAVSNQIVTGAVPEIGKTFIGIFPKFETGRNDLGIHLDPSFNKRNGYDGTAGCIGITTTTDRDAINEFVTKYHPHNLLVRILSSES